MSRFPKPTTLSHHQKTPCSSASKNSAGQLKTFGFGMQAFKKYPEVIPLVGLMTCLLTGMVSFVLYSAAYKPNHRFIRGNGCKPLPWEVITPCETRKLYIVKPCLYTPVCERESIRNEIGPYRV